MAIRSRGGPFIKEVKYINKERMCFFKKVSFYSIVLSSFLFLNSSSFSFPEIPTSKEHENHSLSLSLIGVIVSKGTSSSIAILRNENTGKTIMLTIGENIFNLILTHVFENRIILQKNEISFQIFLGKSNLISADKKIQKYPSEINVTDQRTNFLKSNQLNNNLTRREFIRSEIERKVAMEWPVIIKETRFVANHVNGEISGFKITNLPEKSILSETGILKNDVIKEVNGIKLKDMKTLFLLYDKFKDENRFEVLIERNKKLFRQLYILK